MGRAVSWCWFRSVNRSDQVRSSAVTLKVRVAAQRAFQATGVLEPSACPRYRRDSEGFDWINSPFSRKQRTGLILCFAKLRTEYRKHFPGIALAAAGGAFLRSRNLEGAGVNIRAGTEFGIPCWRGRLRPALHIDFGRLVELAVTARRAFFRSGDLEGTGDTVAGAEVGIPRRRRVSSCGLRLAFQDQPKFSPLIELQPVYVGIAYTTARDAVVKTLAKQGRQALQRHAHKGRDIVLDCDVPRTDTVGACVQILRLWLRP
jgi:hypothetical protein